TFRRPILDLRSSIVDLQIALPKPFLENVVDERAFARTADSGDADEQAEGDFHIDIFQVVVARAVDFQAFLGAWPALGGHRDLSDPGEVLAGQALRIAND